MMSPTHPRKHSLGPVQTFLRCLAWFFDLKSLLTDSLQWTPSRNQYRGRVHACLQFLALFFDQEIIVDGWSTLDLTSPTPSKTQYLVPVHTCVQCLALFFDQEIIIDGWSTLNLTTPTPSKIQYLGAVQTILRRLA